MGENTPQATVVIDGNKFEGPASLVESMVKSYLSSRKETTLAIVNLIDTNIGDLNANLGRVVDVVIMRAEASERRAERYEQREEELHTITVRERTAAAESAEAGRAFNQASAEEQVERLARTRARWAKEDGDNGSDGVTIPGLGKASVNGDGELEVEK